MVAGRVSRTGKSDRPCPGVSQAVSTLCECSMAAAVSRHDSRLLLDYFLDAQSFGNFCTKARARPTRRPEWGRPNAQSPVAGVSTPHSSSPTWQQLASQGLAKEAAWLSHSHSQSTLPTFRPASSVAHHPSRTSPPVPPSVVTQSRHLHPSRTQRGTVRLSSGLFQPYHSNPWPSRDHRIVLPHLG